MKLKNKLYLIQFFILLALIILTWAIYTSFHHQSHHNLENELKKSVDVNTLLLHSALKDTYKTFEQRKSLFTHIHRAALAEFKKDETIPSFILQKYNIGYVTIFEYNAYQKSRPRPS